MTDRSEPGCRGNWAAYRASGSPPRRLDSGPPVARPPSGGSRRLARDHYIRLEADDSVRLKEPHFCARCSRLALSLGVAEWIFALSAGLVGYSSADYDTIAQLRW